MSDHYGRAAPATVFHTPEAIRLQSTARPLPPREWPTVGKVMETRKVDREDVLNAWERGEFVMWVTIPGGLYEIEGYNPLGAYMHIEDYGPVQVFKDCLADMANNGEANISLVATPPTYDDKGRMADPGHSFTLPAPVRVRFENLRIQAHDAASVFAPMPQESPLTAPAEPGGTDAAPAFQDGVEGQQKGPGKPRRIGERLDSEAQQAVVAYWERTGREPNKERLADEIKKIHDIRGASSTIKRRFSFENALIHLHNHQKDKKDIKDKTT